MTLFILGAICYFAIPLWLLAGIGDWYCHRRTHIEANSGFKESLIHSMMLVEMGIPIGLALLFEVNALLLLIAVIMWIAHEATALWDVTYAHTRRYLSPLEQHIHSFLELLPLLVFMLLAALHWPQFLALFGAGDEAADFSLQWKRAPLPTVYLIAVFSSVVMLQIIPYMEELYRCRRAKTSRETVARKI